MALLPLIVGAKISPVVAVNKDPVKSAFTMFCEALGMALSPLSGVLSPAQIAVIQQARALVARPQAQQGASTQTDQPAPTQPPATPGPVRGRGAIINITV